MRIYDLRVFLTFILLIITSGAIAEDWSNWMGFQCEEDNVGLKSNRHPPEKDFILLKRDLSRAYWEGRSLLFENCEELEVSINCDSIENAKSYSIQLHRFTGDIFIANKDNFNENYFFNCSLVKQLF